MLTHSTTKYNEQTQTVDKIKEGQKRRVGRRKKKGEEEGRKEQPESEMGHHVSKTDQMQLSTGGSPVPS